MSDEPGPPPASWKIPAIILVVVAGVQLCMAGLNLIAPKLLLPILERNPAIDDATREQLAASAGNPLSVALNIASIVLACVALFGGISMLRSNARVPAIAGAIAVLLVPACCCCPIGLLPGVWSLVVIFRQPPPADTNQVF